MRFFPFLLALLALGPAHALGPEGHGLVGDIASQYLAPRTAAAVERLLRHDRFADGTASGRKTLGEIASWADEIKDFNWGKARASWHYDNIPVCESADPGKYCKTSCASKRLEQQIELLGEAGAPLRRRNEALKWVVHLVGDIHQPLHAADHHDKGGNSIQVSFFSETDNAPYGPLNLHAIWDVHIVQRLLADQGGAPRFLSAPISLADKAAWERGSIADWISESHELAKSVVYRNLPGGFACGHRITGVLAIDQGYYAMAAPVLATQIRKAGIRLARILNDSLDR
jgi:S1/P1 Nuclease